jgi:hypothetical protein
MADDPTPGEMFRRLEDRLADVRDDVAQLGTRVDRKVSQDIYDYRHQALIDRLNEKYDELSRKVLALETQRERDAERLVTTRRWQIGVVVVPVVLFVASVLIPLMQGS